MVMKLSVCVLMSMVCFCGNMVAATAVPATAQVKQKPRSLEVGDKPTSSTGQLAREIEASKQRRVELEQKRKAEAAKLDQLKKLQTLYNQNPDLKGKIAAFNAASPKMLFQEKQDEKTKIGQAIQAFEQNAGVKVFGSGQYKDAADYASLIDKDIARYKKAVDSYAEELRALPKLLPQSPVATSGSQVQATQKPQTRSVEEGDKPSEQGEAGKLLADKFSTQTELQSLKELKKDFDQADEVYKSAAKKVTDLKTEKRDTTQARLASQEALKKRNAAQEKLRKKIGAGGTGSAGAAIQETEKKLEDINLKVKTMAPSELREAAEKEHTRAYNEAERRATETLQKRGLNPREHYTDYLAEKNKLMAADPQLASASEKFEKSALALVSKQQAIAAAATVSPALPAVASKPAQPVPAIPVVPTPAAAIAQVDPEPTQVEPRPAAVADIEPTNPAPQQPPSRASGSASVQQALTQAAPTGPTVATQQSLVTQSEERALKTASLDQPKSSWQQKLKSALPAPTKKNLAIGAGVGAGAAVLVGGGIAAAAVATSSHTQSIVFDAGLLTPGKRYTIELRFMPTAFIIGSDKVYSFTLHVGDQGSLDYVDHNGSVIAQETKDKKHGKIYTAKTGTHTTVVVNQGSGCLKSISVQDAGNATMSGKKDISLGDNRCKSFTFMVQRGADGKINIEYYKSDKNR